MTRTKPRGSIAKFATAGKTVQKKDIALQANAYGSVYVARVAMGADPLTFAGLAGMGDLVLTTTGSLSRNRALGVAIGQGDSLEAYRAQQAALFPDAAKLAALHDRACAVPYSRDAAARMRRYHDVDVDVVYHEPPTRPSEPGRKLRKGTAGDPLRVVVLVDVSGSMAPYADALLRFAHAATRRRPATEVFTIGTRLTRVSREMRGRDASSALAAPCRCTVPRQSAAVSPPPMITSS